MNGAAASDQDRRQRFEMIYGEHRRAVLGYVLRRTESAEDAADLIADVFLTAWRRLEDVPLGDQARLWLFGVARRALANPPGPGDADRRSAIGCAQSWC